MGGGWEQKGEAPQGGEGPKAEGLWAPGGLPGETPASHLCYLDVPLIPPPSVCQQITGAEGGISICPSSFPREAPRELQLP